MKRNSLIAVLCLACGAFACSDMDEYRKIAGDKEKVYPGKIVEVVVHPGDERVVVEGLCRSDPRVVACRIYWALGEEYVEVPVDMSGGPFRLTTEIPLPENTYNFDIYTYNAAGDRSIPVNVSSKTYGELYKASLTNRLVKSFAVRDGKGHIEWWNIDKTQGPFETQVVYRTTDARTVELSVPVDATSTELEDIDPAAEVEYTTLYRPDELCVDVFRSPTDKLSLAD